MTLPLKSVTLRDPDSDLRASVLTDEKLLNCIFSYSKQDDLQAIIRVNKKFKDTAIRIFSSNELIPIKNFIQVTIQWLDERKFHRQKDSLIEILDSIASPSFVSLVLLKQYILKVKEQLIEVIKTLEFDPRVKLRDHMKVSTDLPELMEDIFELSIIEERIARANLISDEDNKVEAFREVFRDLEKICDSDRALAIAKIVPEGYIRDSAFASISLALVSADKLEKALAIAEIIPEGEIRDRALREIAQALARADKLEEASDIALTITDEGERLLWLQFLSSL